MLDVFTIIEKYYTPGTLAHDALLTHSRLVARKAVALALRHPELGLDTAFVEEGAMLHDIGILYTDAPGIGCHGALPYICHGYMGADLLRREGLPRHALVCERHTGTGFTKEYIERQGLPLPRRDMVPVTLEEQLITYADTFYSKSDPARERDPDEARRGLARFGDVPVRRFDAWSRLFD